MEVRLSSGCGRAAGVEVGAGARPDGAALRRGRARQRPGDGDHADRQRRRGRRRRARPSGRRSWWSRRGRGSRRWLQPLGIDLPLQPIAPQEVYFEPLDAAQFTPERCPVFIAHNDSVTGIGVYGLPSVDGSGVKIALHGGPPIDPNQPDRTPDMGVVETMHQFAERYIPQAAGKLASTPRLPVHHVAGSAFHHRRASRLPADRDRVVLFRARLQVQHAVGQHPERSGADGRDRARHQPVSPVTLSRGAIIDDLRSLFLLDPSITFLNHGSFGACPQPVFEVYQRWQRELERQPVEFLGRRVDGLLDDGARAAGGVSQLPGERSGVRAQRDFGRQRRGALARIAARRRNPDHRARIRRVHLYVAARLRATGAQYVAQPIPLPYTTPEAFVEQFWAGRHAAHARDLSEPHHVADGADFPGRGDLRAGARRRASSP